MGLLQFTRMPFGGLFQRLMDEVCNDLPLVMTNLDDVLIHSATIKQHKSHLHAVLERLKQAGLTLQGKKCQLGLIKGCLHKYVQNFADIAVPLNLLIQKDSPFVWDSSCQ